MNGNGGTGLDGWVLGIGGSGGARGGGGWRRVQVHIGEGVAEQCARSMRSRYDYRKPSHNYFLYVENVPSPLVSFLPPLFPSPLLLSTVKTTSLLSPLFLLLPPVGSSPLLASLSLKQSERARGLLRVST